MNSNKYKKIEKYHDKTDTNKMASIEMYSILIDDIIYQIELIAKENNIKIKYNKYELNLNLNDFNSLTRKEYTSIDDCFDYLSTHFNNNNISIKQISNKQYILFSINSIPEIELHLEYKGYNSGSILTDIIKESNDLKTQVELLKDELNNLKKKLKDKENFNDPKNIEFNSDIIKNSFANYSYEDSFVVFQSIENILQIVYTTNQRSINSYDLNEKTNIFSKMKAHESSITNFKYYFEKDMNRDIIMSISKKDNNIKIWNAKYKDWQLLNDIKEINKSNCLFSACFFKKEKESYIITSNGKTLQPYQEFQNFEPLKIYKLEEDKLCEEISDWNDCTYFIDVYYDNKLDRNYIITGNYNYVKAYDYDNDKLYHKYYENNNGIHPSVIINKFEEKIKLIESCADGNIRIWGFHSGNLIKKIYTDNNNLYGICLWNDNYIFVGCKDQSIKLIELQNGLLIKSLKGHKGRIISFKKIKEENKTSEYLFSQGLDGTIKLWTNS